MTGICYERMTRKSPNPIGAQSMSVCAGAVVIDTEKLPTQKQNLSAGDTFPLVIAVLSTRFSHSHPHISFCDVIFWWWWGVGGQGGVKCCFFGGWGTIQYWKRISPITQSIIQSITQSIIPPPLPPLFFFFPNWSCDLCYSSFFLFALVTEC